MPPAATRCRLGHPGGGAQSLERSHVSRLCPPTNASQPQGQPPQRASSGRRPQQQGDRPMRPPHRLRQRRVESPRETLRRLTDDHESGVLRHSTEFQEVLSTRRTLAKRAPLSTPTYAYRVAPQRVHSCLCAARCRDRRRHRVLGADVTLLDRCSTRSPLPSGKIRDGVERCSQRGGRDHRTRRLDEFGIEIASGASRGETPA
jgi:hypothetical protein